MFPSCLIHHAHKYPRLMTQLYKYKKIIFNSRIYAKHWSEWGKNHSLGHFDIDNRNIVAVLSV